MMAAALPYVLSGLSLFNITSIWLARKAILRGDWFIHRNYMVASLGIWGATLLLFSFYLWMRGLIVLIAVPEALFGLFAVSVITTGVLLIVTLIKVARHQFLPHKLLARKTLWVWIWTCALGILFFPLTDAHIIPL